MYQTNYDIDIISDLKITVIFIKIVICLGLLFLGVHITLWSVEVIDNIINHTDQVMIFNNIIKQSSEPQIIEIMFNADRLEIKNNGELKWLFFILIFIILFNVIGRVLGSIFTAMVTILKNLNLASIKSSSNAEEQRKELNNA